MLSLGWDLMRGMRNVALSDHEKYVKRESEKEAGGEESDESSHIDIHPAVNLKLKIF